MANSDQEMKKRMARVEQAIVQLTALAIDQSERMDSGFRELRGEIQSTREALSERLDGLGDRLDRLIAVTMKARTQDILEERVGV